MLLADCKLRLFDNPKVFENVVFLEWSLKKLPRTRNEKPLPTIFSNEDIVKITEIQRKLGKIVSYRT